MRGVFKIELSSKCEKKGCKEEVNSEILDLLLRDRTTEKNILWATNDYENILAEEQIRVEQLDLIQPRFKKILQIKKIGREIKPKFLRRLGYAMNKII